MAAAVTVLSAAGVTSTEWAPLGTEGPRRPYPAFAVAHPHLTLAGLPAPQSPAHSGASSTLGSHPDSLVHALTAPHLAHLLSTGEMDLSAWKMSISRIPIRASSTLTSGPCGSSILTPQPPAMRLVPQQALDKPWPLPSRPGLFCPAPPAAGLEQVARCSSEPGLQGPHGCGAWGSGRLALCTSVSSSTQHLGRVAPSPQSAWP